MHLDLLLSDRAQLFNYLVSVLIAETSRLDRLANLKFDCSRPNAPGAWWIDRTGAMNNERYDRCASTDSKDCRAFLVWANGPVGTPTAFDGDTDTLSILQQSQRPFDSSLRLLLPLADDPRGRVERGASSARRPSGSESTDRLVHLPRPDGRGQDRDGAGRSRSSSSTTSRRWSAIDMSEFMEKHAVSRLVGAPPGYVGYDQGGFLTEAVRRRPYSVVLFDEIEKAHPDVFNIFLQILDDGRLTDGHGRTVDFRNTVLIMTSNIGSQHIVDLDISEESEMRRRVMDALRSHFKPEFLNRVDDVVIYHPLGEEQISHILDIQLELLRVRLGDRRLSLELTDAAVEFLAKRGYDPQYGARPLKRLIQREVQDPLAMRILEGEFVEGTTVRGDLAEGGEGLQFH